MKTLLVYFSADGNTEQAALAIAPLLTASVVKLAPVKAYPRFILARFPVCALEAMRRKPRAIQEPALQVADFDRILIGTPTWMGYMAPPVRQFIRANNFAGKQLAFFATCSHLPQDTIIEAEILLQGATVMGRRVFTHADLSGRNGSLGDLCQEFVDRLDFN